jgi:hypothetical protein
MGPAELERLLEAVRGGRISSADAVRETICAYRGLDAFREEVTAFFFGHGAAVAAVDTPFKERLAPTARMFVTHWWAAVGEMQPDFLAHRRSLQLSLATPETWRPMCFSIAGAQRTSAKPRTLDHGEPA